MRRPAEAERLYLDFDGFFASVEQYLEPRLRGRPVGVVPTEGYASAVIAVSREAKLAGVKTFMRAPEARALCRDIVFVPQRPALYRRAHNALVSEIHAVIPIDTVKSIDELTCRLDRRQIIEPLAVGRDIKKRLAAEFGPVITCSIGFSGNRLLAKMACKAGKWGNPGRYGDGLVLWRPSDMPAPLLPLPIDDIPGVGRRLKERLTRAGFGEMAALLAAAPKQMRALWGNLVGEQLWYALHGYTVDAQPAVRSMYGHSRVLDRASRGPDRAYEIARVLLVKAARRMRRDGYGAARISVSATVVTGRLWRETDFALAQDDHTLLQSLHALWAGLGLPPETMVTTVSVALGALSLWDNAQLDLLHHADHERCRWQQLSRIMDEINTRNGKTLIHIGQWLPPEGGNTGGKIAFNRVPDFQDFW